MEGFCERMCPGMSTNFEMPQHAAYLNDVQLSTEFRLDNGMGGAKRYKEAFHFLPRYWCAPISDFVMTR